MKTTFINKAKRSTALTIRRFGRDEGGNFAMMLGLAGTAVFLSTGLAVDSSRLYLANSKLSAAIDAAVLATTRDLTSGKIAEEDAKDVVKNFVLGNLEGSSIGSYPFDISNIVVDKTAKTVAINAHVDVPLTFMKLAGTSERRVGAYTKAAYSNTQVEVAMALDVTGSMDDDISSTSRKKIDALKAAANIGIDELIPNAEAAQRVRIGLVPYSASVNIGSMVDEIDVDGPSDGCVYERTGPHRFKDTFASGGHPVGGIDDSFLVNGEPITERFSSYCPDAQILPLTNSVGTLKGNVNAFTTGGCTAGHIAIAWTQYMLSPKWNRAWPADSQVGNYGDSSTRKYAIIMTDGIFNTHPSSGNICNEDGKAASRQYALNTCGEMKSRGIKVFTIAFAAPTQAARMMDDCANDDTTDARYFYDAATEAELKTAFEEIAKDIQGLRLVN